MLRLSTQLCVFLALAVFCLTPALAQDDVYYPDNYTASSNVENFHNMPRFSGGNDFDYESQDYIIGVVSTAVIFFAIAVLMLIFIPIWYLCSCMAQCFGKCCCSSEEKATHQSSWFVRIMWGIALVGVLVGVSVGMEGNEVASQGAAETADIIVDGAVFFERAVDIVIDAIAVLDEASQELDDLESACILFQVDGTSEFFEETFTATNASLSGFYTDVNGFSTDMRILGDTVVDGDAQRHDWTLYVLAGVCVILVLCLVAVLASQVLHNDVVGKIVKVPTFPLMYILIVIVWLIAGVSMFVGVGMSDFCIDPDLHLTTLGESVGFGENVEYYTTCRGVDPFASEILFTKSQIIYMMGNATLVKEEPTFDLVCPGAGPDVDEFVSALNASIPLMDETLDLVGCPTMNGFYQDFVHDLLCTTTMDGLALVFTGSFLVAFFLPLVMFFFKSNTLSEHEIEEGEANKYEDFELEEAIVM